MLNAWKILYFEHINKQQHAKSNIYHKHANLLLANIFLDYIVFCDTVYPVAFLCFLQAYMHFLKTMITVSKGQGTWVPCINKH